MPELLQTAELRRMLERELFFFRCHHLEEDHFVTSRAEQFQCCGERLDPVEAVADQEDQTATLQRGEHLREDIRHRRLLPRPTRFEQLDDLLEGLAVRRRLPAVGDLRVERDQPGGVSLSQQQVRQSRRQLAGVIELGDRRAVIGHAPRAIDDQIRPQVGLLFVFLDVVVTSLAVGPPVDVLDLVAGVVLPMLDELDRRAFERRLVLPDHVALDEQLGDDLKPAKLGERRRISQRFRGTSRHERPPCPLE